MFTCSLLPSHLRPNYFSTFSIFGFLFLSFFLKTGGWSILLSMLDVDKKPEQQEYAAWAIGTAVKNSYDFQLWLLQSDVTHPSELILKTNNKKDKNYNDNKNKFENKIDIDGKNDLTGKLNTGIGKDFSFDDDNHDIQNQNDINNDDKSKNNNDNDINNGVKINEKSDNNKNNKLSLIPVTQNQTIPISKNQNNSNVNNNNKKIENIKKSMTGIEKLVSLLYHSTNNESFIMQNRPNLDELQVNVLYAISVAIRLNPIVQGNLIRIVKSDFSFVNNGDINKNESSSVGGKVNIDQSVFMNYLIKIAEQSNRNNSNNNNNDINNDNKNNDNDNNNDYHISYELTRKVWTFIADMLEERGFTRGVLSLFSDLPEETKEVLNDTYSVLMGDFFLTEFWFNLAGKTFENFFHLYTVEIEKKENLNFYLNVNGDIIDENDKSQKTENTASTDLKHGILRSILENILVVEEEIISQNEIVKLKLKDEYKKKLNSFLMTLNIVTDLKNDENEGLIEKSKSLLEILA